MFRFTVRSQKPVPFEWDGKTYEFPRFSRADWAAWAQDEDLARENRAVAGLTPEMRARVLLLFPVQPITKSELQAMVNTPAGAGRVFRTCAERSEMPADEIGRIVDGGEVNEDDLENFAVVLASIVDEEEVAARVQAENRRRAASIKQANAAFAEPPPNGNAAGETEPREPGEEDMEEFVADPNAFAANEAAKGEGAGPLPRNLVGSGT